MKIKKDFELRTVMGQNVILAEGNNTDTYGNMITLNPSAAFLWRELKDRSFTADDAANLLIAKYGIDPTQAQADAAYIIAKLTSVGCVEQ